MNIQQKDPVVLRRDCDALLIPAGAPIMLPKNSSVFIVQALGGNYTVNINGNLAQVAASDADALGFEAVRETHAEADGATRSREVVEQRIWEQLKTCYDPEIPVNIVDLGLVYDVQVEDARVAVKMTLTAPGCGMGGFIASQARQRILEIPDVKEATVDLVWDPPWDPKTMVSEEIKDKLGIW